MSSLIGVSLYKLFNLMPTATFVKLHWLLCSLSVSISLFCMQVTHMVGPPVTAIRAVADAGGWTVCKNHAFAHLGQRSRCRLFSALTRCSFCFCVRAVF